MIKKNSKISHTHIWEVYMYINHVFHFLKYVFLYVLLFLKYIKPWSCQFAIMNDLLVLVILSNTHIIYITAWETIFKLSSKRLPSDIMTYWVFSSPGPKVQVNYCHHLASVVCQLFTFQASSPKPLGRLEPNLAGMFLGWSSTKFFVPVGYSIWLPGPIICSDWLKFQQSSSLKLMNWLNPNCKWMITGMSFTKLLFFMPIGNPRWPPSQDIN